MNEEWKRARRRSLNNREFLIAISDNNFEEITRLINEGVNVNFKDQDGHTALSVAIECADLKVVQLLIKHGADLTIKNANDETPLDIAKRKNHPEMIKALEIKSPQVSKTLQDQLSQETPETEIVQNNEYASWINPVHGHIFQLKVLMLFLYRGVACKYSFRLGTEVKKARKFDDLVFEYTQGGKKVYRLLQAKHKIDETKRITVEKLLFQSKDDYSLVKYFHSYQDCKQDEYFKDGSIKDVTICTNINFDFNDLKKFNIQVEEIKEKDDILDVKSKTKNPIRYKFNNSIVPLLKKKLQTDKLNFEREIYNADIEDFLKHLVFAVDQPNEEELGDIVKNEIGKELDFINTENVYNKFFMMMLDWMKDKSRFMSYNEGKNLFDEVKKGTFLWYNIQDPVKSFVGRQEKLADMHRLLQANKSSIVCVCGLGGVGKTELVKKYVSAYSQNYDNKILWINAENHQTLVESFRKLACDKLGIGTKNADGEAKQINTLVSEVYQYFSKSNSLFIFDNAEFYRSSDDSDSGIDIFLPTLPSDCIKPHIIITSRNQKWPKSVKKITMEGFTKDEAETFISSYLNLGLDEQREDVRKLAKQSQLLPLALQQAVAYIKAQNDEMRPSGKNYQICHYIQNLAEKSKELLNFEFPSDCDNKYSKTVFSTWNVTLDTLKKKKHGQHAIQLLNTLAYLLPNDIPIQLLLGIFDKENLVYYRGDNEEENFNVISAINLLQEYSLIKIHHSVLNLHRLVQQVTRLKLAENNEEENALTDILKGIVWARNPIVNSKNVDHFLSAWKFIKKHDFIFKDFNHAISKINNVLMTCGRTEEAYALSIENTKLLDKLPSNSRDDKHLRYAARIDNANALMCHGKCEEALKEYMQLYESIKDLNMGKLTLDLKSNIANSLMAVGRDREALKWQKEVLAECEVKLGKDHPETWLTKREIADFLTFEGKYDEALVKHQEIHRKLQSILGNDHVNTMQSKKRIASLLRRFGLNKEAMKFYEEIYTFQSASLIENHPDLIETKTSMASLLADEERVDEALKLYNEVFEVQKCSLGMNHPETLETRNNIGMMYFLKKDFDKARSTLSEVYKIQELTLGKEHPSSVIVRGNIDSIIEEQKMHKGETKNSNVSVQKIGDPISAIKKGNLAELKRLLTKGVDINAQDENKGTLLHHAINSNQPKIIEFLLNNGADVNRFTDKGNTPLHLATSKNYLKVVKDLLIYVRHDQLKEFIDAKTTKSGSTALHVAVKNGSEEIITHLLSQGATFDLKNNAGQLPADLATSELIKEPLVKLAKLFKYAEYGKRDLFDELKKCSVKQYVLFVNARNSQGYNLLQVAVLNDHDKLVNHLRNLRSNQFCDIYSNVSNYDEITVDIDKYIDKNNSLDRVRGLIKAIKVGKNGIPNPNICTIEDMLELLESNKQSKFTELAKSLIEFHVTLLRNSMNTLKMLFEAVNRNDVTTVQELISKSINVDEKDNKGWTALYHAVNVSNEKIVKMLLNKGAKVCLFTNSNNETPLHVAASKSNAAILELLLKSHSSFNFVNAQTKSEGSTACHIAVETEHMEFFEILLKHGADLRIKNKAGKNPGDLVVLPAYEE